MADISIIKPSSDIKPSEATVFAVVLRNGIEEPALFHDYVPAILTASDTRKLGVVYVLRLDRLPDAERWLQLSLSELFAVYRRLKAAGRLPAPNLGSPRATAEPAKRLLGYRERLVTRTWEQQPPDPFPEPGTIQLRPDAGTFIPTDREP